MFAALDPCVRKLFLETEFPWPESTLSRKLRPERAGRRELWVYECRISVWSVFRLKLRDLGGPPATSLSPGKKRRSFVKWPLILRFITLSQNLLLLQSLVRRISRDRLLVFCLGEAGRDYRTVWPGEEILTSFSSEILELPSHRFSSLSRECLL